ncbi:hypothetical protein A1D25_00345 [Ursidibacter arcticus]|nr:hypothetical protein A1D25_00345 [Ursidibacter arcticus]
MLAKHCLDFGKETFEADLNPKIRNRNKGERKPADKNPISPEQEELLINGFMQGMFQYQRHWYQAGETILLPNGAELIFLGTNSATAQSYHGNLYFDEIFWVPKFDEMRKVASAMASQKQYRQTYFSTPTTTASAAYEFWSGKAFNLDDLQRCAVDSYEEWKENHH